VLSAALADDTNAAAPAYTSLAGYVTGLSTRRGRPDEFTPVETGEASIRLQNRTGAFDPTNTGGPFYGDLLPLRPSKISFANPITGGAAVDVFTGYLEDLAFSRQGPRGAMAVASLVDGFELFANADVNTSASGRVFGSAFAAQHVDDRIKAAAADAGWPAARTRVATGNVNVRGAVYEAGSKELQVLQDAAAAEFPGVAMLFMDKSGFLAFSGRGIRFDPTSYPDWVTRWRVGDAASCALDPTLLPIAKDALEWSFGKEQLYNDVVCAPDGVSSTAINSNHVIDATSIGRYGHRSLEFLGLQILNGTTSGKTGLAECLDYSHYYVNNYKVPRDRITSIEFHGQMDNGETPLMGALWNFILHVEVNHIVEVHTINPGGGGINAVDYYVEQISNDVARLNETVPNWTMRLGLSPRARFASYP
jgi:hypothetical protein